MKRISLFALLIIVSGCLCCGSTTEGGNNAVNASINSTTTTTAITTTNTIDFYKEVIKASEKKCPVCEPCSNTVRRIETTYINETVDISDVQMHQIKNLIPKISMTASCSAGYFEAKYAVFDIFEIKRPKFSERSSSDYNPFKKEEQCVPVYNDGFSDYFEIPNDVWYAVANDTNGNIKFRKKR